MFAVIAKVWLSPSVTLTVPVGLIEPPSPAEAVIELDDGTIGAVGCAGSTGGGLAANDAAIVYESWAALIVYVATAPTETPLTETSEI